MNKSAGVDCTGFVQRSGSYASEDYEFEKVFSYDWNTINPSINRDWFTTDDNLVLLSSRDQGVFDIQTNEWKYPNLEKVIPGDIIYYLGYHVMIIDSVDTKELVVKPDNIQIIESTWGANNSGVIKVKSIKSLTDADKHWVVGRITGNE
jgi:hypothetical protein